MTSPGVHVDDALLGSYVAELGAIGETSDGMYRFRYDDAWQRARDVLLEVDVVRNEDEEPATMDEDLIDVLRGSAEACGASWRRMPSGAGHDSQLMAARVPTAMLSVPSVGGRSHTPAQYTSPEGYVRGASVLATALHHLAY